MRFLCMLSVPVFALALVAGGCQAGNGDVVDDDGDGKGGDNTGSSTGSSFGVGGGSTGGGCTEPMCVGSTPQGGCDSGLAIGSTDAMDGARAIGLCQVAQSGTWGVTSAEWVRSDGQPLVGGDGGLFGMGTDLTAGKGILTHFGNSVNPREGATLLALSSGSARNPGEPDFQEPSGNWKDSNPHGAPAGYPKESPSCPGVTTGEPYDSAGLRIRVVTPIDAKSLSYNLNFYTYEFPAYICDVYNDFFVAMLTPKVAALPDGNISFDAQGNTVSVNAGFLEVCTAQSAGGKNFPCPQGPGALGGTGFEDHAATGWLETKAPIEAPGSEITLHFAVWDSGDGVLDSTALIDNFRFELNTATTGTTPVPQ